MPDTLVHELKIWKLACPINDYDLAFPSPEGKITCHDNVVKRYFNPALRKAGLRHVSFHSLRHTNPMLVSEFKAGRILSISPSNWAMPASTSRSILTVTYSMTPTLTGNR